MRLSHKSNMCARYEGGLELRNTLENCFYALTHFLDKVTGSKRRSPLFLPLENLVTFLDEMLSMCGNC